ncbi:winged helix-turn-helix domain-containing protein [Thiomicrorhabdus sp. Milos-T2]|uniref:winged helix-turn-helix domain-containing protein n=1 Tax=Thiomicrorhabdus sp. Milos-T2 TaxID=90814 RepID=UPI000494368C|nr:LysR family transcriptional regulator [Thiomicrorhabdus sp. Milos-T2]
MSEDKSKLPGEAYSDNIRARFWITGKHAGYIGIGRIELLEKIEKHGSMSQAAKSMGMSYKKAWKLIDELNAMYDEPLIVKAQGGKSGGGSVLTPKGKALIKEFRVVEQQLVLVLQQMSKLFD